MSDNYITPNRGISASVLKNIAYITMIIDHTGHSIIGRYYDSLGYNPLDVPIYVLTRTIGRLAFPIFIFMLVEGYYRTRNKLNYFTRLLILAFISEIPYNLVASFRLIDSGNKNVMFDLSICFLVLWGVDYCCNRFKEKIWLRNLLNVVIVLSGMALEAVLGTDYAVTSVGMTLIFYLFCYDSKKLWTAFCAWIVIGPFISTYITYAQLRGFNPFSMGYIDILLSGMIKEYPAVLALIPILSYNGKKGRHAPKYVYYAIYPVQFILIYILSRMLLG